MTKVLIHIKGGSITGVFANVDAINYVIVDEDLIAKGEKPVQGIYDLDGENINTFHDLYREGNPVDDQIREELKRLKF